MTVTHQELLGQEVEVVLEYADERRPSVVATGKLLAWDTGGEVILQDEMGFVHYCWPMLSVKLKESSEA